MNWLDEAIFYEIYPQSFCDSNGDGIGDFNGIISRLDYIKNLGCNAIWMNPCFDSPFGDAGYDVSDYYKAAPRYGTNEDLQRLFELVHSRGMHILLDLVPGHTSIQHPWFQKSMKAEKNEYTDRYIWTSSVWEEPQGIGSIKGISERDGVAAVNFFSHQPALNYGFYKRTRPWQQSPEDEGPRATLEEMKNVMRFWLNMGCDGFRVDMAGSLVKNDENSKGTIALWQNVRAFLDREYPDAKLISEWGEPDKSLKGGFHMDFLLHFGPSHYNDLFRCKEPFFSSRGRGDAGLFVKNYIENYEKTNRQGLICIPSGNHDMDRLARHLHDDELKIAFAFLLSMPGAPFIYYGDEIGMRYVENLTSVEGGYGRTGSRSPMQWDSTKNAGFSTAEADKLYIPLDPYEDRPTAEAQMQDADSLYNEVRKLIGIRRNTPALQNTSRIDFVFTGKNKYPLAYLRGNGKDRILVIINPSKESVSFPTKLKVGEQIYQMGKGLIQGGNMITVYGQTAAFYTVAQRG
ncbi:MAG: hypothetical protein IJ688_13410 [Treponema sp.]|nr:hypothetical protein [Treponema sp.]